MKDIRIISLLLIFSVLFTFSACSRSAEPTSPSEEQQSAQTQENQPTSESETENSADDSLQQQTGQGSNEKLTEPQNPGFVKIEVGVTETDTDYVYGVFALDSNGNLYFGTDNNSLELIDTNVKDFYSSEGSFYLLKENGDLMKPKGDVMESQDKIYQKNQDLVLFYHDECAEKVSHSILTLPDRSILSYQFKNDIWNPIDISASYVDGDYLGAGIIDKYGTLWYLNRITGELNKIAKNVIDCSYSNRNKIYYSNDIWYITSDHTMHIYQTEPQTDFSFPENVEKTVGSMGQYLAKKTNGDIVFGSLWNGANNTNISGQDMDIYEGYCAILDENGVIHFGEIQQDKIFKEISLIYFPK